jgi:hypothetical protein
MTDPQPHRTPEPDPVRWTIRGDPALLTGAAAELRGAPLGRTDGAPLPGDFVMFGLARLLDSLAAAVRAPAGLPHDVVSAAEELSRHVLTYVRPGGAGDGGG